METDLEPVDILAYITEDLQTKYEDAKDTAAKAQLLQDFLRRWDADTALDGVKHLGLDFKKDLDWFNVSKPLTMDDLSGKVVVLDFFTYCCINCMHVFPELHKLQELFPVERGLAVVGVHSPKFENEKDSANILAAIQRYEIEHPIVNDTGMHMWRMLGIRCWPTLIILSPTGDPILMIMGEGHIDFLQHFIEQALRFFGQRRDLKNHSLPLVRSMDASQPASQLQFPAKIARSEDGKFYAIADAGNHRILVTNVDGHVTYRIGSGRAGLLDGNLQMAAFNKPQGVVFLDPDILIVADTENHAIRQITLSKNLVETISGTGHQGDDRIGGKVGPLQELSSPWDVAIFRTRDMDMSFHMDEQNVHEKTIVLISMAGTHQIWGYFPEGMIWWKFRKFEPHTCVSLMGNGVEENRNNSYPQNAAFAQPSGLTIGKNVLYIADSESSSIRKASMIDGKVTGVVGGDRNPQNLFAFGDVDGKQHTAKLQHPLGVAYNPVTGEVAVADTYNHKIKLINSEANYIETLPIKWRVGICNPPKFYEPSSLCFNDKGSYLLVSDTNNHRIIRVDMKTYQAEPFPLKFGKLNALNSSVTDNTESLTPKFRNSPNVLLKTLKMRMCKVLTIQINFVLSNGLRFTADAPQRWSLNATNSALKSLITHGQLNNGKLVLQLQRVGKDDFNYRENSNLSMDKQHNNIDSVSTVSDHLKLEFCVSLCDNTKCIMKRFSIILKDEVIDKQDNTNDIIHHKRHEKFSIEISSNDIKCN